MAKDPDHKLSIGFRGLMMRIPPFLSEKGARRGEKGAAKNAMRLSIEERNVHHYIVKKMAVVKEPITTEMVANELKMPNDKVNEIIEKLEELKTFIYRGDGKGINWAYPFSLENTGFKMTASTGESFFAA